MLLKTILFQSALGTLLTLVLMLLKPITRIFGSRWQYYSWLLLLLVMILPPLPGLVLQKAALPVPVSAQVESVNEVKTTDLIANPFLDIETRVMEQIPFEYRRLEVMEGLQISQYNLLIFIWLAGAAVFFIRSLLRYLAFMVTVRKHSEPINCPILDSVKVEKKIKSNIRVYASKCVNTPFIAGFFQPILLLPDKNIADSSLRYVLLHELTHYKRYDLCYKWFALVVNGIHWFNPLIYLAVQQMNEECENSCDYEVVKDMDREERKGYMNTILCMMEQNKALPPALTSAMAGGIGKMKRRFNMISKAKRQSRLMSVISFITAVMIFCTTLLAGNVIAADSQDGLEKWIKNEVYVQDGIQFSINVSDKSVPAWVYEDIAGLDGNIQVTVKRVQTRNIKGEVEEHAILELMGAKGTTSLSNIIATSFGAIENYGTPKLKQLITNEGYVSGYQFCEFNNEGFRGYRESPIAALVTENSGKHKYVDLKFVFDKNERLSDVFIQFLVSDEADNVSDSDQQKYMLIKADSDTIQFQGNFEKDYVSWAKELTLPMYFTFFEKNLENKKMAGINLAVASANTKGITLHGSISHPQVSSYAVYVYNQKGRRISSQEGITSISGEITLEPARIYNLITGVYKDVPENQIVKGGTYRVDMVFFDKEYTVIHRQQEYIKIP